MKTKKPLIPRLRFPEFKNTGEWEVKWLGEVLSESKIPSEENDPTKRITVRLNLNGVEKREYKGTEAKSATHFYKRKAGQFIYGKQNFHKGAFGIIPKELDGYESSSDLPAFDFREKNEPKYIFYFLSQESVYTSAEAYTKGTGSKRLNEKTFLKFSIPLPPLPEQQKIAGFLSNLDEWLAAEEEKLTLLETYKKGLLQNLFPAEGETVPKLRFPEFQNSGAWEVKRIGDILEYERPDKYIVISDNYVSEGIPVLTANKSFILGYTQETFGICNNIPAIIFDDFTVDKKFVDFPFKVKSSAIKILRPKDKDDLKFLYELMSLIRFEAKEHKRYYISVYQNLSVPLPSLPEQQKIADCLSALDEQIEAQRQKVEQLREHKKGLLQNLFPKFEF